MSVGGEEEMLEQREELSAVEKKQGKGFKVPVPHHPLPRAPRPA